MALAPVKSVQSNTPAVQQAAPQRIVVGQRSSLSVGSIAFADGLQSVPLDLLKAGLLRKLRVILTGNLNIVNAGAGTLAWAPHGVFNLFGRPVLATSENSALADMTGWMHYIINACRRFGYDPTNVYLANATTDVDIYNQPNLVAGNNPVAAALDIYCEMDTTSFVGLVNLQEIGNAKVQLTINTWGNAMKAVVFGTANGGNAATFTGSLTVQQESYEVPQLGQNETLPPLNLIHRYRTKVVPIQAVGVDVPVNIDPGPTYSRIYIRQQINGVDDSLNLNTIAYQYGLGKTQIKRTLAQQLFYQRDLLGKDLPTGHFILDFGPSDVIRSLDVASPTIILNVLGTAVLGSGNNIWEIVTEEIVPLS